MEDIKQEEKLFENHRIAVDPGQNPIRIDKYLMDKLLGVSRNKIQNGISEGKVLVNEKNIKSNYKVQPNDLIVIMLPKDPSERTKALPEKMELDIRYEDDDLIILHKPAGLVVHPGVGNRSGTLVNGLVSHLNDIDMPVMEGNDYDRPGIVHRIDKDTTGLMVIAKTEKAMTHLARQFADHTIDREYIAIVWGDPDPEKGTVDQNIGRDPKDRQKMTVFMENEDGKHAITHYEVLESFYYVSIVKCVLETGRTHQIRVHMSNIGHPLFNDSKYGGDRIRKGTVFSKYKQFVFNNFKLIERHALHARSIGFIHPTTNEYMKFESELPQDMQDVIARWKHYAENKKTN